jgi:hypothetical protein
MGDPLELFPADRPLPEGFAYRPDLLSVEEERELVERLAGLPLVAFDFHGYTARRRTISFGWHYDFGRRALDPAQDIPGWLPPRASPGLRRNSCRTCWCSSMLPARPSAGTATRRYSAT